MVDRWIAALGIVLLALGTHGEDPEFAATAPAKVLLPVETTAPAPAQTPASESQDATKPAEEKAPEAAPAAEPVADAIAADISAEMDRQAAAENSSKPLGADSETTPANLSSPARTVARGIASLCATLVVILLIFAALKRWGKRTPLLAGQQLAKVMGRVGLSPQASLHFVQTNGEVLIIGVTQQHISLLRTFDAADFEAATEVSTPGSAAPVSDPAASFLAQLKESRASMGVEAAADEDLDQLKGELQRLKQYFQDTTRARD